MTELSDLIQTGKKRKPGQYADMLEASRADLERVSMYGCADAAITLKLHNIAMARMAAGGVIDD